MDLTAVDNMAQLRLFRFSSPVAVFVSMDRFVLCGVCFNLALLAPVGRPMLVSHQRLLGLVALFRASASVSSDIGTERQRTKINKCSSPRKYLRCSWCSNQQDWQESI